jgi:hypothetical protein
MARLMIAFALVTTWPVMVSAQEEPTEEAVGATTTDLVLRPEQGPRIAAQLFLAPLYFMAYITAHEGSHALMSLAIGRKVTGFWPYPHYAAIGYQNGKTKTGFFFGRTSYNYAANERPWQAALVSAAPYMFDLLLFTASDLLLQYAVDPHSAGAPFLLAVGMITPLVNFVAGLNCMDESCDMSRVARDSGIPRGVLMAAGYGLAFTALWRCLHQFRRIFLEQRSVARRRRQTAAITIQPMTSYGAAGLGLNSVF